MSTGEQPANAASPPEAEESEPSNRENRTPESVPGIAGSTSLHRSLLGPSLLKAGQQGVDQQRVGEIIYNASLGSKFFENEKRRDEQLTRRIEELLKRKKELEEEAGTLRAETRWADETLAMLEESRDLSQVIVHVDCDAFYASVEELDRPELKNVPFAVGGGVLTTCNYRAREFGVRSGMAGHIAKKICPQLVMVPINFEKYKKKAGEVREVLVRYDERFEAVGCDEAFLNITKYLGEHPEYTPETLVEQIRKEVNSHAKITVSAGIGPNAKIAKIASNENKPNGQFRVPNDRPSVLSFVHPLPVRQINGIGRVFERELSSLSITTISSIHPHRSLLRPLFGEKAAFFLLNCYLGLGRTEIRPIEEYERKSVGTESTFRDLWGAERLREKLKSTAEELEKDLQRLKLSGRTLVLKVKLHTYQVLSRQRSLSRLPRTKEELYELALPLLVGLEKEYGGGDKFKIRLMGLRVTQLVSTEKLKEKVDVKKWFFGQTAGNQPESTWKNSSAPKVDEDGWEVWPDEEFEAAQAAEDAEELKFTQELDEQLEAAEGRMKEKQEGGKEMPKETWDCPICSRPQVAEDKAFNEHVDFCLSKEAIREAVKETAKSSEIPKAPGKTVKRFWTGVESGTGKRRKASP